MVLQAATIQDSSPFMEIPLVVLTLLLSVVSAAAVGHIGWRTHRPAAGLSASRLLRIRLLLTGGGLGTLLSLGVLIATIMRYPYGWLLPAALLLLIACGVLLTTAAASAGMLLPRFGARAIPDGISPIATEHLPNQYPDLILFVAPDGRIEEVNATAGDLLGYTMSELIGQPLAKLIYPEHQVAYEASRELLCRGIPQQLDVCLYHKANGGIHLYMTLLPTVRRDRFMGIQILGKQVNTEIKQQELNRRNEKLAALGNLAAGIAHEIRNPLTVVKGMIQFNRQRVGMQFHYDLLMGEISQIEAIISDFLMLSSETPELRRRIDFVQLVHEVVESAAEGSSWQLIDQCKDNSAWIHADENKLARSLRRLFMELQELVQAGGRPILLLGREDVDVCLTFLCEGEWEITSSPAFREGELYYDTKSNGTGLAYMVAYHIFTDHGANMQVCSSGGSDCIEIRMRAEWALKSVAL